LEAPKTLRQKQMVTFGVTAPDRSGDGVVTRTWIGAARGLERTLTSDRGSGSPRLERFISWDAERAAGSAMTLDVERVFDGGVNGKETLG
jgi:hypothetical protein